MKINQFLYSKKTQRSAQFLLILTLCQLFLPTAAFALTGGPSQPEVQSFEPIGTTEMVDLSSGAFNYNIPLLEVEGYPINLAYHAGASMDAEASTVGLGWNINPGVINRNMRGLPDDFNGDAIVEENNRKPNITVGVGAGLSNAELIGLNLGGLSLNLNLGVNYNNYAGVGFEFGMHPSLSCATKNDPDGLGLGLGLGLSSSTSGGATISPSVSYGFYTNKDKDYMRNISLGGSFNRRQGLASLSLGMTHNKVDETIVTTTDANGETASYSKFTAGAGNKASAAVTFGNPTYMPSAQTKMSSLNLALNVKLNPSLFGFDPGLGVNANGYFSVQSIASSERNISNKAYGTLYEQNHTTEDLIDFNREKLMPYTRFQSCNLSVPVMAQDVYGVSGQGIGGSYQLKRNDVGMMHDKSVKSISGGGSIGLEAGFGPPPSVKFGGDADVNISETYTGRWQNDDNQSNLAYRGAVTALDEPAYFKSVGDVAVESDPAFIAKMGNGEPQRIQLNKNGIFDTKANPILESSTGTAVNIGAAGISRAARERRSQAISYLTAEEAEAIGAEYPYQSYPLLSTTPTSLPTASILPRVDATRKAKHLSVVTTLRDDGTRYVYGIPAYNLTQVEKTFAIGTTAAATNAVAVDLAKSEVAYSSTDNTKSNAKGIDRFFHGKTMPAYAHSFLLTSVFSTDYIDRTLNGPSDDDYGSYTKINYGKASNTYNWRAPYTANKASYDRGLNANTMDDKATYIYGQKEIWNISTIESKHQVALFYYGDRTDLVGVAGENGGLAPATDPNQKLKRLEKIELYSKENFNLGAAARIPIKTVYFEYDYSLCQGIDNTSSTTTGAKGKLTLKRVYFAYGKSNKAKMNPYTFTYNLSNPAYNPKAYDRWGTYKPNPLTGTGSENAFNGVSNADFPYTKQNNLPSDKTDNDGYAAAWNLSAIQLPSGGTINVEYEAADYAYVQDKQAMEMVPIFSIEETPGTPTAGHNELYNNNSPIGNYNARNIIYFDIPATRRPTNWATMTATDKRNWLQTAYIKDLTNGGYLYFKCLTKLSPTGKHDYITGFSEVSDYGVTGDRGFVKLKPINIADRKYDTGISAGVNPISKAAWNFTRVNYPDIAFLQPSGPVTAATFNLNNADDVASVISNGGNGIAATVVSVVKAIASAFIQVSDLVTGVNLRLQTQAIGQSVALDKSWIRLYSPDGKKVGGGYRVKSVKISDGWDAMATATNAPATANTYGQLYDYTTLRDGKTISSGVTAYEPLLGGDESPFYQPIIGHYNTNSFEAKSQLTVADELLAGQIGESYFPAPNIVYSKVTVTSLKPDASTPVTRHGTGRIVHEYYTAKDFPVIVKQTGLDEQSRPIPNNSGIAVIFNLFKMVNLDYMTASQGYSIETNNMHGQAKSQAIFDENGDQISSVTYTYQTKPNGQLDNTVKVVNALGAINNAQLGVEIQMVADEQESRNKSTLAGIHGNMDSFLWPFPPIPIPLPAFLPFFSMSDTRFRAVTTAKQINRIGILKSTKVVDKGSTVSTDNIAYDEETGTLLVTKVNNDFEDAVYKMNYPAYWRYKGMGLAYQNIGANQTFANMVTAVQPGDEILVTTAGAAVKHVWVTSKVGTTSFTMIDQNGAAVPYTAAMTGKIVRSFYRNLGSMPMGEVVLKTNPVAGATLATLLNSNAVLNASATEFADRWHTFPVAQYEPCGNIDFGVIKNISTGFNNATNSLIPSSITSLDDEWRLQSYPTGAVATPAGAYLPPNGNGGLATVNMYATWIAGTPNATWLKPNTEAECTYTYFYCFTVPSGGTAVLNVSKVAADNHIGVFLSGPNNTSTTVYVNDPTQNCSQFSQLYTVNNTLTLGAGNYCLRAEVDNYGNNCPCPISIAPRQSNNKAASVSDSLKTGAANRVMIGNPTGFLLEGTLKINSTSNLPAQYNQVVGNDMNPYQNGIKGNWRPRKTYTFLDERVGTNVSTAARPRSQGVLTQFTPFWQKTGSQWLAVPGVKWQWTEEATQITPDGLALESKDPLGRYNAELLGYDNKIVKATVSNSRRREALYDGFEDYKGGTVPPANTLAADLTSHLLISNNTSCDLGSAWNLSTARSHTGTTSLKVSGNIQINLNRMPDDFENAPTTGSEDYVRSLSEVNNAGYTLDKRDCIMPYAPRTSAHKVVVSAWVYGAGSMGITDVNAGCDPTIAGPFTTGILPSGVAIEGWKRIYKVVDVPAGAKLYVNLNGDNNTYFDDIRIMPYDANMKSYVYDQVDYKLRAELDANNYATFYEYDQSGALTRVKRETERGVMTVKESRSSLTK